MKRLIADTGPLLHLHEAGGLHLVPLIGKVSVPRIVLEELQKHAPDLWPHDLPAWVKQVPLTTASRRRAQSWAQAGLLHAGEAEALALAEAVHADWFLTDDAAARLLAKTLGIAAHGSLGVVLWAAGQSLISKIEAENFLTALTESSLWVSPRVRAEAQLALEKLFN